MSDLMHQTYIQIISSNDQKDLIQELSIKIVTTTFQIRNQLSPPSHLFKSKAYEIYVYVFNKIIHQYKLDVKPLTQSHFGKILKRVYNVGTKRLGPRGNSFYAYDGLLVDYGVLEEYENWLKRRWLVEQGRFEIEKILVKNNRIELLNFLKDQQCRHLVLVKCDAILRNFDSFDLFQMKQDWKSVDLQKILEQEGLNIQFQILDIFTNPPLQLNIPEMCLDIQNLNQLKINIINKIMEIINHKCDNNYLIWQFISTKFLEELTQQKSTSFGSFWILKCLIDELLPFIKAII